MGIQIRSREDFEKKFEELKDQRDLFAFLLFDERPSQQAVGEFADKHFLWLDRLARSVRIFFFIFLTPNREWGQTENPGLEVGGMFGIRPNQLPGVVLFSLSEDGEGVSAGVYLPIDKKLFERDLERVEDAFSDLFSLIAEAQEQGGTPKEKLTKLERDVASLRRRQKLRPYMVGGVQALKQLPQKLLESLSSALIEAGVRQGMPLG